MFSLAIVLVFSLFPVMVWKGIPRYSVYENFGIGYCMSFVVVFLGNTIFEYCMHGTLHVVLL